ncbi:hypothetical protein YDYSG_66550 [Paenibacillus tyrfis]|uniref:YjgB family protein n=1 Tax=Paenibacillus tyrfis TaxID=1501230 RepID=UPI002492DB83|nr:YjgB family protein [Paenibacillus tyrfis]GLI10621.1 hypothetical protein YDYSG_66550 [Paenibacillus tyrfis]
MHTIKRMKLLTAAAAGLLALTACQSGAPSAASKPPESAAPSQQPGTATTPEAPAKPAPSSPAAPSNAEPDSASVETQLKDMLVLARKGQVKGSEYAAHTGLIDEVEKKWGKADQIDSAGKGLYATYKKRGITFGFNKGELIFDVRSYDPELHKLTLPVIEKTLGKPKETAKNGDDQIYVYQASEQFELKFVIPAATGKVDHISVFSPQDAKNNMAG